MKFKVLVEESEKVKSFIEETKERLLNPNMVNNPFSGEISYFKKIIAINLNIVYPNISLFGLLIIIPIIFFKLSLWFLLGGLPFALIGFFHSKYFIYLGFVIGLRKKGYKGKIKLKRWSYVPNRNL